MIQKRAAKQRGAGTIGCLLLMLIVGGGIYAGVQLYLPQLRDTSFQERLTENFPFFSRQRVDVIRGRIIMIAEEFDIALKPAEVQVDTTGGMLTIDINYTKTVDLKVWKKDIPFKIHRRGPY